MAFRNCGTVKRRSVPGAAVNAGGLGKMGPDPPTKPVPPVPVPPVPVPPVPVPPVPVPPVGALPPWADAPPDAPVPPAADDVPPVAPVDSPVGPTVPVQAKERAQQARTPTEEASLYERAFFMVLRDPSPNETLH